MTFQDGDLDIALGCAAVHPDQRGGQHVAKYCTGVRVTHRASGNSVLVRNYRSQHHNLQTALAIIELMLEDA